MDYYVLTSGAPRAKRACGAPWVNESTHPRKFGNHVTDRATVVRTTGIPMFTLTLSSYFGCPGESRLHINVVINWQLSKQGIRWPVSRDRIAGSGVDPSRSSIVLKLSADNLLVFKWSQAHVYFFFKFISNMFCLCQYSHALLRFWFQTDLRRKNSASFVKIQAGKTWAWSRVGHAPRPICMLWLVKIWQASSFVKFMQHLESCLLWQLKLTEFWVNLWCF